MLKHCKTIEELKREYRRLAMQYHPDHGGSTEQMQQLNNEYEQLFERLQHVHESAEGTTYTASAEAQAESHETAADFVAIVDALLHMDGVTIEQCGRWLWIGGNTYTHRDALKEAGCRWQAKKRLWYWHPADDGKPRTKKTLDMESIREKYGSESIGTGRAAPALAS